MYSKGQEYISFPTKPTLILWGEVSFRTCRPHKNVCYKMLNGYQGYIFFDEVNVFVLTCSLLIMILYA